MRVTLTKTFHFESAHWLPTFPEGHKCRRMHGHSFRFDIVVSGDVPAQQGYLVDYGQIAAAVDPIVEQLDHRVLNDVAGLTNPTAELLAKWVYERVKPRLALLELVRVHETCTTSAEYRGE